MDRDLSSFFHLLNPNRKNRSAVQNFFRKHPSLRYVWIERATHPTHLETVVNWAITEGKDRIAVWGGDGTLSRVVQALHQLGALEKVCLAIVPVGTGNDFTRYLRFPSWDKVVKRGLTSRSLEKRIDVGVVAYGDRKRTFINNAGFGRSSSALNREQPSAFKDIAAFTPKRITYEWTRRGERHFETRDTLLGVVFNAPYFNRGLHFETSPNAQDGSLDGYFEPPQSRWRLMAKFIGARFGRAMASPSTFSIHAESIVVESPEALYPQADGETLSADGVTEIRFDVLKQACRLTVWV